MLFFGKKDEKKGLPELPPSNLQDFPIHPKPIPSFNTESSPDDIEKHALPTFPDSPSSKGFSQTAIKDAVSSDKYSESDLQPIIPKIPKAPQIKTNSAPEEETEEDEDNDDEAEEIKSESKPVKISSSSNKEENVFVRLDKFHSSRRALNETKTRLEDIDSLLKKIREIKQREEQELSAWEKEVTELKAKIQSIRENIFDRA